MCGAVVVMGCCCGIDIIFICSWLFLDGCGVLCWEYVCCVRYKSSPVRVVGVGCVLCCLRV